MLIWSLLGCACLAVAVVVIVRLAGASLGPYSTRLLGIAVVCVGYYGTLSWLRFAHPLNHTLHWHAMRYVVPGIAGAGALYCLWRVVQGWRAEIHGLVKTLLLWVLLLVLGALAWLCLTH